MATDPGFHVDPAALRALAGAFDIQAGKVAASSGRFAGPARHLDHAFGLMGPSDQIYSEVQQAVTSALDGLGTLQGLLSDAGANLRTGADNYERSDHSGLGKG